MIHKPAMSNTEFRVLGANLLSKKTSSATKARNGHSRLETNYMREMAFWNIFDGVNRHSCCGNRAAKGKPSQQNCQRRLEEAATSIREDKRDMEQ